MPRSQVDVFLFQGQAGLSDLAYNQPFFGRCPGAKSTDWCEKSVH
jgi:hypothetical protein